ncbi:hypothetical protein IQ268_08325 [Oculatella sp. LEGE 06141]|uniref:hypothetical protein n=1 Tax=Oculatella sp. LEGE 06141 TaxID=1828648 RepID=UPI0018812A3F|nr:hypothetical protein [Oculatella sp. LEGE 06141]MBE9178563.1 hypothetical protein [Oculatella sp. LEGE 06141]
MLNRWRHIAPAIGLFFLSPWIGEFLLGNLSIDALLSGLFAAPLYGGGALLIREVTRRTKRGWATMILLGLAYAVVEEGLVTQSLFNPSFVGLNLLDVAYIPVIGMGAWWTLYVLTLHTVWSTSVVIALVEALVPNRRTTPWLGKAGLAITTILFIFGAAIIFFGIYSQEGFLASPPQLIGTLVTIAALIAFAFKVRQSPRSQTTTKAPIPRVVGFVSLLASSLFMALSLVIDVVAGWVIVGVYLALYVLMTKLLFKWLQSAGWGDAHRLALAGGALLTYAWYGFPQPPTADSSGIVDLIGNGIFAIGAIALLAIAHHSVRQASQNA